MLILSATDLKPYAEADYVKVGGTRYNDPGANTDIDGNITIDDVLVPGLDPGIYSVIINVDGTVAIGELEVLAEDSAAGAGAELPGALEELGDSLLRVFHFNGVDKSWDFYDPRARLRRPEHADHRGQRRALLGARFRRPGGCCAQQPGPYPHLCGR